MDRKRSTTHFDFSSIPTQQDRLSHYGTSSSSQRISWEESEDEELQADNVPESPVFKVAKRRPDSSAFPDEKRSKPLTETSREIPESREAGINFEMQRAGIFIPGKEVAAASRPTRVFASRSLEFSFELSQNDEVGSNLVFLRPTQLIQQDSPGKDEERAELDPTQTIGDSPLKALAEYEVWAAHPDNNSILNGIQELQSCSESTTATIESVHSSSEILTERSGSSEEESEEESSFLPRSSSKKCAKRKFGLTARLERVLQQRESDLALKDHVQLRGGIADETSLAVLSVREDLYWRTVSCQSLGREHQSKNVFVVLKSSDFPDGLRAGAEIMLMKPFHVLENCDGSLTVFGVRRLEILDQALSTTSRKKKTINMASWECQRCEKMKQ